MSSNGRLLITSIVRHAELEHASGFVRVLELDSGKILMTSPVPESVYRAQDMNPRGGLRGARGVSFYADRLALANNERILLFDANWHLSGEITHPLIAGIHDLMAGPEGIWVTSTVSDLLIHVDWNGELIVVWEWRAEAGLRSQLGFGRLASVNRSIDFRKPDSSRSAPRNLVHLNSISRSGDKLLLLFGRVIPPHSYKKRVVQGWVGGIAHRLGVRRSSLRKSGIRPGGLPSNLQPGSSFAFVELDDGLRANLLWSETGNAVPNHNIAMFEDRILYNDTNRNELVSLDLASGSTRRLPIPGVPGFLRGMALSGSTVFIGSQSPAAIYQVDLAAWQIERVYELGGVNHESVYAVALVPDAFVEPPVNLDLLA